MINNYNNIGNNIGNKGMSKISEVLKKNSTITELNFKGNIFIKKFL